MNRRELNKDFSVFKSPISSTRDTPLILIRKIIFFITPYYFIHPIPLNLVHPLIQIQLHYTQPSHYCPASWQLQFSNKNSQDFIANIESSRIQNVSGNLFLCTPFN